MPKYPSFNFKLLFENKTVGIIIVHTSGKIIESNQFAADLFGYTIEEMTRQGMLVEQLVPHEHYHKHQKNRSFYKENPHTRIMGLGLNLLGKRKDGSVFPVEISLSPHNENGEIYTTAFITDITIRKAHEEKIKLQNTELENIGKELEKLNSALEKKVEERTHKLEKALHDLELSRSEIERALEQEKELGEMKSRFVSMASHEFRTPLSTILSSASLLKKYIDNKQTGNCERHVDKIKSSVEYLNNILEDFLSIDQIETGEVNLNLEKFDATLKIKNMIAEIHELVTRGQTIHFEEHEAVFIQSDKLLFKVALSNILSNAIKFSKDSGHVKVSLLLEENSLTISVQDEGIGIPKADQKHLFTRFYRATNSSNIQGTGLGTYIAKKYVEILGGSISFHSTQNKGTTFKIKLPYENHSHH